VADERLPNQVSGRGVPEVFIFVAKISHKSAVCRSQRGLCDAYRRMGSYTGKQGAKPADLPVEQTAPPGFPENTCAKPLQWDASKRVLEEHSARHVRACLKARPQLSPTIVFSNVDVCPGGDLQKSHGNVRGLSEPPLLHSGVGIVLGEAVGVGGGRAGRPG
jgi:hypothetical protein